MDTNLPALHKCMHTVLAVLFHVYPVLTALAHEPAWLFLSCTALWKRGTMPEMINAHIDKAQGTFPFWQRQTKIVNQTLQSQKHFVFYTKPHLLFYLSSGKTSMFNTHSPSRVKWEMKQTEDRTASETRQKVQTKRCFNT